MAIFFNQNMSAFGVKLLQLIFVFIWCPFQIDGERDIDTVFADVSDAITPVLVPTESKSSANERILNKYLFCLFSFLFYIFIFSA